MDDPTQRYAQPTSVPQPPPQPIDQPQPINSQPIEHLPEQPIPAAPQPIMTTPEPVIPITSAPLEPATVIDPAAQKPLTTPVQAEPPAFMNPASQPVTQPSAVVQPPPAPFTPTEAETPNPLTQLVFDTPIPTVPTEAPLSEHSAEAQEAAKAPTQTFAIDKNSFVGMLDLDPQAAQIEQMAAQSQNPAAVLTQAESQADKEFANQLRNMGIPEDAILEALKAKQQERPELAPSTQLTTQQQG